MDIFEFSQSQASEPETKITKDEYIHRSKLILEAINKAYTDAWHINFASEKLAEKSLELHGDLWRKFYMV